VGLTVVTALALAGCGPPAATPAPVGDDGRRPADLGDIPQPGLATLDLGTTSPGFDGPGDFYSYESDLSPDATAGAYAGQLLDAGYRDAGRLGSWRVFVGPVLTVWLRVGTGGPPTSLLVRVQPTSSADLGQPDPLPSAAAADATSGTSGRTGSGGPKATSGPTSQRRPDPPHAPRDATAAGPAAGSATSDTAGAGSSGTVAGTTGGGTPTGGGAFDGLPAGVGAPDGMSGGSGIDRR
jgi:hypothetical protein